MKMRKHIDEFENLLLQNQWANFNQTWHLGDHLREFVNKYGFALTANCCVLK